MKTYFLNHCISTVKGNFPEYSEEQLLEIRYGIESIYLSISKVVVILFITWIFGFFQEAVILLFLFNLLRIPGFGLHASKSWMCWISSSITFIGVPLLCQWIEIPRSLMIPLSLFCILNFWFFAPADTKKRPLVNRKKRMMYKLITVTVSIIYTYFILTTSNVFLRNALFCAMLIELVLIHPVTYRLFKLPYNNYKSYVFSNKLG